MVYSTDRKQNLRPAQGTVQKAAQTAPQGRFPIYFLLYFMVLLKQLRRLYISGFIFQVPPVYNYSTYYTNRMPTRLVRQVRVYAFSILTTYLHVWCTYKALTNQKEDILVYRPCSLLYIINNHHLNKYIILHIFRAYGYDLLVLLSQYKQILKQIQQSKVNRKMWVKKGWHIWRVWRYI